MRKQRVNKLTKEVTTTWDRENMSTRQALASYVATASSLGYDVHELCVSEATLHRMRIKNREQVANELKECFLQNPLPLVLHWDGKFLPSAGNSRIQEDRIAVLVSGNDFEELLGVPVAVDGTG